MLGVATERSKTLLLVKNLDVRATQAELAALFGKHGQIGTVLLVPGNTLALVEFLEVRFTHKPHKRKDARA
jgi:multiple RNA-binding domain-containing protein 1|tara:strand:- start:1804 stop:2016 length:213 start_codon:yes stop_codon:yes gene_type:complete